jgi:hypothetical protein
LVGKLVGRLGWLVGCVGGCWLLLLVVVAGLFTGWLIG